MSCAVCVAIENECPIDPRSFSGSEGSRGISRIFEAGDQPERERWWGGIPAADMKVSTLAGLVMPVSGR